MASSLSSAQERWAFAALLTGATGIGFAPVLVRLSETGPTATAFYRLLFALPIIWLWMALAHQQRGEVQPRSTRAFGWLALSGLLFAADLSIWHWALQFTTVTNSTLITNLAPLLVAAVAWLFLGEKATRTFILGLLIATAGAAVLVGNSYVLSARHLLGDLLSLVAAVFYAGYLVTLRHLRATFSTPVIMAWAGLSSCIGVCRGGVGLGRCDVAGDAPRLDGAGRPWRWAVIWVAKPSLLTDSGTCRRRYLR
jgi:drug/metabolite transporter (DMT)-like permease